MNPEVLILIDCIGQTRSDKCDAGKGYGTDYMIKIVGDNGFIVTERHIEGQTDAIHSSSKPTLSKYFTI